MKKRISKIILLIVVIATFSNCGSKVTICDCLKDQGAHKKECDKLGNSMTSDEMNRAIAKCK